MQQIGKIMNAPAGGIGGPTTLHRDAREIPRQTGVTLIEVLVAIALLSMGLLGLAGLQLRGMQVNQGSAMRSQATIMAEDLADRMRADFSATNSGAFIGHFTPADSTNAALPQSLTTWLATLSPALPGSTSPAITGNCAGFKLPCVSVGPPANAPAGPPTPVEIDVYWNDARASNGSVVTVASYSMVVELSNQ